MGYQNICVSSTDLGAGPAFLKKLDYSGSLFLSANVLDESGKAIFEPGRLYTVKGIKIGVIALTDRSPTTTLSKGESTIVADTISSLQKIWNATKKNADLIILLTSLDQRSIKRLVKKFPDIDLVISSGLGIPTYSPFKADKTLIVSTHPKGKSVGLIALKIKKGIIYKYDNRLVMLKESLLEMNY